MMMEEELGELESRANSLLSEFGKRGGVPKVTRVDAPHSKFVAAGGFHSAALDDEGLMWTWGRNTEGQLGLGDTAKKRDFFEPQIVSLDAVNGKHMRLVTCGVRVSAAVDENGSLWTWGDGKGFLSHEDIHLPQLGGSYDVAVPRLIKWPASVDSNIRVAAVSLGWSHTVVLDESGNMYTWGYGGNGRLGHGDEQTRLGPARVQGVPPHEMAAVAAGGAFTVARSKSGLALAWGAGHCSGQGEYGSHEDLLTPEIIPLSKGMDVTAVAAGGLHAALLTRDGGAYTWGWGECGQLGLGLRGVAEVIREPTQVDTENQKITMVACGAYHTALVEEGGELMTFGAGGKRRVATTTEDDERGGSSTAGSSRPGSKQGARLSQSKGSARHSHSSKAGPGPGPGGEDDPGVKRDKQGFTKEEREAFNLELAGRAMNLKSLTGTDNKKVTTQDGYQDYVIRRREKVPDGTLEFKKYLKDLEKEETKAARIRSILKREGEKDDEIKIREENEKEAEWDRRMDMWWGGLMVWVKYMQDVSNPMRFFRRMGCCLKPKADEKFFRGRAVVRTKDDEDGMALARQLDGKNGEMCRLGYAGMEELREDGAGDRVVPRVVTGPWRLRAGSRVIGISCGPYHTLAVTESGEVYAFGVGMNGRLGTGDEEAKGAPTHVIALSKRGVAVGHPGRQMGLNAHIADDEGGGGGGGDLTQAQKDALAVAKLTRTGGGGGGMDAYRAASLPNRGRKSTLAGSKVSARAYTPTTVSAFSQDNGGESPPPELNDDELEAFTGVTGAGQRGAARGPRRTVIDDLLGPPTLGIPKM